ncbi:MAG: CDP-alcohol phosphatidyltransferase family protein [Clostridia bacterium]|nr:CDP-alcohol phosphatidyltransferase family protein [Clostridia bacterium]
MIKYSMQQIRESLPKEKNKGDSLWVQYVARNISYPFTFLFINIGLSAWQVSVLSILVAFMACFAFCINNDVVRWVGVILIHFWMICDCVDGNIARVKKTTGPMGEFIDAQSGYIISAFCYFGLGVAAFYTTRFSQYSTLLLTLGSIASIANILSRLIHQKYTVAQINSNGGKNEVQIEEKDSSSFQSLRRRIGKEIGLSGMFMILVVLCQIFKIYDYVTVFYFLFCMVSLLVVIARYSIKAKV